MRKSAQKWIGEKINEVKPGTKPSDLRMPIPRAKIAETLAHNAVNGFLPLDKLSELAQEAVQNNRSLEYMAFHQDIHPLTAKAHEQAILPNNSNFLPGVPESGSHHEYLENLLVPQGKIDFLSPINEAVLNNDMHRHAMALDALRNLSNRRGDHCYEWVIQGKLGKVLRNLEAGKLPGYKADWLRGIVRTQARCLAWFAACQRIYVLRRLSTKAYDKLVESLIAWPTVSHACIVLMVGPANLISDMLKKSESKKAQREIDVNFEGWVYRNKFLPRSKNSQILLSNVRKTGNSLVARNGFATAQKLAKATAIRHLDELNGLLQAKTGHFRELAWTKLTYPEFRLKVSASEGTAFVAEQLRQALERIDQLMDLPRSSALDAQFRLYHIATLLRGTIEPDKNSAQVGQSRDVSDRDIRHPNPYSNAGAQPFKKLKEKLQDKNLYTKLEKVLGFSADEWF